MKKIIWVVLIFLMLGGGTFAGDMRMQLAAGTYSSLEVTFIGWYKGNSNYMLTEDSYNTFIISGPDANYGWGTKEANYRNTGYKVLSRYGQVPHLKWYDALVDAVSPYAAWTVNAPAANKASGYGSGTFLDGTFVFVTPNPLTMNTSQNLLTPAFTVYPGNGSIALTWESIAGADGYLIYKRNISGPNTASSGNVLMYQKVTETTASYYIDPIGSGENNKEYFYMIIAKYGDVFSGSGSSKISAHSPERMVKANTTSVPVVLNVTPRYGNNDITVDLTITGVGFTGSPTVMLQPVGTSCTIQGTPTETQIVARVPISVALGTHYAVVTTGNGSSAQTSLSTYEAKVSTTPPSAPTGFNASSRTAYGVTWGWAAVSGVDYYGLFTSGGAPITTTTLTSTTEGSAPNTSLGRYVKAHNVNGYSTPSNTVNTYTYALAPYNLTAEATSPTTIRIYWRASSEGGSEPTKYDVFRSPDGLSYSSINSNVTTKWYQDSTVAAGTPYWYQVKAANGLTEWNAVPAGPVMQTTPVGAPTAPALLSSSAGISTTSIVWNYTDNSNNENYFVLDDNTSMPPLKLWPTANKAGTGSYSTTEVNGAWTPNQPIMRYIGASNEAGTVYSGAVTKYTLASPPSGLTATGFNMTTIRLNWTAGTGAVSYRIYRSATDSGYAYLTSVTAPTVTLDDSTSGTKWYMVRSVNSDSIENSADSNHASGSVLGGVATPTVLTGEAVSSTAITWRWVDNAADETSYELHDTTISRNVVGMAVDTVQTKEGGLLPCSTHTAYVTAVRGADTSNSTSTTKWTLPVKANPPTFESVGQTWVRFYANRGSNNAPTYNIERKLSSGGTWAPIATGFSGGIYYDYNPALSSYTSYDYRVYAVNGDGVVATQESSTFTISTLSGGTSDTLPPTIESVSINGRRFRSGDIIPGSFVLTATVMDLPPGGSGIVPPNGTTEVIIDDGYPGSIVIAANYAADTMMANVTIPQVLQNIQAHSIKIRARDNNYQETVWEATGVMVKGSVQVIGPAYNFPNPFKPLSASPSENTTKIAYTLNVDATVSIIIYDITGHEVHRATYHSGVEGGRAGVNQVVWNGRSIFGEVSGNGMYLYKIISGNKVIGSGKLVILD